MLQTMKAFVFRLWLTVLFAGCAGQSAVLPASQATAGPAVTREEMLRRVFSALDQQSTTVNPMAKVTIEPPADSALDARLAGLRTRMERRLAAVDVLKARGIVGEDDRGYLEARDNITPEQEAVRSDENADRREAYQTIATEIRDGIEHVGRQRAQRIALLALRGGWLKSPGGGWYQKP